MNPKARIEDLAVFGGRPSFPEKVYVGRPNVGDTERPIERLRDLLERRRLANGGPFVVEFERRVAELTGVKHCIATCNATIALQILVRALGLAGEVIIPSFTFIATAHALEWQGITPVFADISERDCNLDPGRVEKAITSRTSAILGVHLWGRPCNVEALADIAARHRLKLLFDAAHAFGCTHHGRPIGNFGDAEVFSFHATKFVNSFEGGVVATNDDELAARVRLMHNFGFAGYDEVVSAGTNGKMTEIAAAMGITSMESLQEFIEINRRNYLLYEEELTAVPGVELIAYHSHDASNYQYIVLDIDERITGLTRDQLQHILWAENIMARRYFYPGCHRMEPYRTRFPDAGLRLPCTERLAARVLSLPNGTAVDAATVRTICQIIRQAMAHGRAIGARLKCLPT
jgi:dTDP-4-amino-4,6-dideoxygalactose transaminase